jgi:hypothetical protein
MFSSPITGAFGAIIIVLTWLNQAFVEQGIPKSGKEWITFLLGNATGLAALFAKDFNKSNSGTNLPTHTVPPTQ